MHSITEDYLHDLWSDDGVSLSERYREHLSKVEKMDMVTTGVIGRDLLIRMADLFEPRFFLAAFLATNGETGNDGFLDFTDSVAILPTQRYQAIMKDPDVLIDDSISRDYRELGFVEAVTDHFDELAGLEESDDFLSYLVFGMNGGVSWVKAKSNVTARNAEKVLPRLFARSGHILP